jgi:hypothetical protein
VDHARARKAHKRGGANAIRVPLEDVPEQELAVTSSVDFERLDEAPTALRLISPERATVARHWTFARAWLYREMHGSADL